MQPIPSLAVKDLSCERGGRLVFEDVSFSLSHGEGLLVTGANGAGKTSLLRMIAGLLPIHAGHIAGPAGELPLPEQCHYVGHLNAIKTTLSVRENIAFCTEFLGGTPDRLDAMTSKFGLGALGDLPAGLLSAGQKRKLALLRLFAAKRPIWLLDEPSVSLDVASVTVLAKAIASHLAEGGIAVVSTHTKLKVPFTKQLTLGAEASS